MKPTPMKPARPLSWSRALPLALALAAPACASAPTPVAPAVAAAAPTPEPAPVAAEPAFPYPWLFLDQGDALVISDAVPEAWLAGPPALEEGQTTGEQVTRPLNLDALPKAVKAQVGRELEVVALGDTPTCRARITGLEARAWIDSEIDEVGTLWPSDGPELSAAEFAARLWALGRRVLVAQVEMLDADGKECDRPFLAAPAAELPLVFANAAADAATSARAAQVVRAHAFWATQEEAYQQSLKLARAHRKKLVAAGYDVELPKGAPAHWDSPIAGQDYSAIDVEDWTSPSGGPAYHMVRIGNDLSCAAPEAWFLLSPDLGETLAYGVGTAPQILLDVGRDGSLELAREGYPANWIERLDRDGGDRPAILRETWPPAEQAPLWCAWEQVPPLAVIDEVLHPKPTAP
ncbi:MAG: hypothetical protein U1F43_08045 [Myxococcota bacterium]